MTAASTRQRIALVTAFFGGPPPWLPALLRSCEPNPRVQWLIYADFKGPAATPSNVTFKPIDLDEFNRRASAAAGTAIRIEPAYLRKICDFKPLYGLMFADDLRDFEFWGCSDLDVIWGDIGSFITDQILDGYNVISSRQRKVSGHFTLFRNTEEHNRTFDVIPDVAARLREPQYLRLDENILTEHLRQRVATSSFKARPRIYWEQEMTIPAAYQKALADGPGDWRMSWREGKAFDAQNTELMYLHFHKLKKYLSTLDFGYADAPRAFTLSMGGIARAD